jgi:hypothetical protein
MRIKLHLTVSELIVAYSRRSDISDLQKLKL